MKRKKDKTVHYEGAKTEIKKQSEQKKLKRPEQ